MLQVYDLNKKAEHFAKTRLLCRDAVRHVASSERSRIVYFLVARDLSSVSGPVFRALPKCSIRTHCVACSRLHVTRILKE